MKKFINAEIELISFEMTDIITTSGANSGIGDFFDGEGDNNLG